MTSYDQTIAAYDASARELAERYDALPGGAAFAAFEPMFSKAGLALDVGAGSGRDAAWLQSLGYEVVAAEPSAALCAEGARRRGAEIRWIDDRLPGLDRVHRLGLAFDLILLSAVWQHILPGDRPRAFRKLSTLLRPGGLLGISLRSGPAPADRPMFPTSVGEVEGLARTYGMEVLKVQPSIDLQNRDGVTWTTLLLRMPDDGTGALPLVRGIVLSDDKSSTYKLGLLRAVARIAEHAPAAARPADDHSDAVEVPLGLVALFWVRMYLPLVRLGLPQAPRNNGPDGLGFAKAGFRALLADAVDASDLRIGAVYAPERGAAVAAAIGEAATTIASMPANFTRFPNSDRRVFEVTRERSPRRPGVEIGLPQLNGWGRLVVPGHLWRALSGFGAWIEPMLIAEWTRLILGYAERMGLAVAPGVAEAALEWREPLRTTAIARLAVERMNARHSNIECIWTGRRLSLARVDIDHCLPWSAWPCGDLWNLLPCDPQVNRNEKRGRLPSAALLAKSRDRIVAWWQDAYLSDPALNARFMREASAALPLLTNEGPSEVFSALDWRRLRLLQDQQVPEWRGIEQPHTLA